MSNGFNPFKLNLFDGRSFNVRHSELIALSGLAAVVSGTDRLANSHLAGSYVLAKPIQTKST
jgi:hypothetical protein